MRGGPSRSLRGDAAVPADCTQHRRRRPTNKYHCDAQTEPYSGLHVNLRGWKRDGK